MALILGSALVSFATTSRAQPAGGGIEMEGEPPPADQPPPAVDQLVVKDAKVAKTWIRAAEQLVKKGDQLTKQGKATEAKTQYDNAVTAYQKAIEASDDMSLNFQLAITEDKAGNTPDGMKHLKVVIAAQGQKPDVVKKAQAKLDELSMKVGVVTLAITPEGTAVSIGGTQVGEAPLPEPLVLMPGTVTVSFAAVGYQPKDVELKIEAGSESERKIVLDPVPIVTKPAAPEEEKPAPMAVAKPDMLPIYIGGGATIGLTMIGTITGIMAIGKHSTFVDEDPSVTAMQRADAKSSGQTLAVVTDLCLVGALGAAGFTAYWYIYKWQPEHKLYQERQTAAARTKRPPRGEPSVQAWAHRRVAPTRPRSIEVGPKVAVAPWVQPQAGGLIVGGSF